MLALGTNRLAHVGVHVGDENVQASVVVEVEHLDAHRAPGRPREHLTALPDEALAAGVLVVLVVAEHVEHIQIGPAVVIDVNHTRVARPGQVHEAGPLRDVNETISTGIAIQNASFGPGWLQVARKRVLERDVVLVAVAPNRVRRIPADVDEEQVEPAVAVVIEEHGTRRVSDVGEARGGGDVAEAAVAVVLEEHVAAADRRDVKVRIPIIVDVGKRGRDADLVRHRHAGRGGDVLESAAPDILRELVAPNLVDEVDVGQAVPIDVRNRYAVSMIVVSGLVRLSRVVHDPVLEGDAARVQSIRELKVVEHLDAVNGFDLCVPKPLEPRCVLQIRRDEADCGVTCRSLGG